MRINKYSCCVLTNLKPLRFKDRAWAVNLRKTALLMFTGKGCRQRLFSGPVSTSFPPQERGNVSHRFWEKKTGGEGYKPYKLSCGLALEEHWSKDIYPYLCCKAILREHVGPANRVQRAPDLCGVQPQMTSPDIWGRYPWYEQLICGKMLNTFQWQKCVECCALLA